DYERLQEMTYNPMSGNYMGDNQAAKIEFFLEDTSVEYLTEYLFRMKISKCIEPLNLGLSDVNPKPYDLEAPEKAKEAGEIGILARCLYELSGDGSINQKLRNFLTQAPCASVFIGARPASWIDDPPYVPGLEADLNDFVKRFNNLIRLYSPDTKAVYGITPVPGSRSYILYEQNAVIGELDLAKDAMTPNGEAFLDAGTKALLGLPASEASEKLILKLLKSGMDHRIGALLGYGIDNAARYARYQKLMFGIPTSLVERVNIGSIKILSQAEYLYRFGMLSPTDKEIVDRFMFQELRKIQTNESFKFIQGLKGPEVPISWITFNTEETAYLKGRHEAYLKHAGAAWQRLEAESLRGQMNGLKQVQNTLDNI
ncbi:MAG: hypothetical protein ABH825_03395, partial [Candidatus Omnitrophota bacterium]